MSSSYGFWLLCVLGVVSLQAQKNKTQYRLPPHTAPTSYNVHLTIKDNFDSKDPHKRRFDGEVTILFSTTATTSGDAPFFLNSYDLSIRSGQISINNGNLSNIHSTEIKQYERLAIHKVALKRTRTYCLTFKYSGFINKDTTGLYVKSYRENDNEFWYIATQMQPAFARRVFPCFDEPRFKATFRISVTFPKKHNFVAVSNTDIDTQTTDGGMQTVMFKETPRMSPHMIALILSNFKENVVKVNGISYKLLYPAKFDNLYKYAQEMTPKIIKELEAITGEPYKNGSIENVVQAAMPHYWQTGAENWGLVLHRADTLLLDEKQVSAETKQKVATAITSKLAQAWFGNLKTPQWWNLNWLNEGFATFYQFHALAKIEGSWELENQFVVRVMQPALWAISEAPLTPRPKSYGEILTTEEIDKTLHRVVNHNYGIPFKGASIIRMVKMFLGEDLFDKGIKSYMSKGHYASVTLDDLWNSWEKTSTEDILPAALSDVMEGWVEKTGFPLVRVSRRGRQVKLTTTDDRWYIPITYTTSKDPNFEDTMPKKGNWIIKAGNLTLDEDLSNNSWIVVNLQNAAYIRVAYDKALWNALANALQRNHKQIHVLNRAQIVNDVLYLALQTKLDFRSVRNVLGYLRNEVDYYPWYSASFGFNKIKRLLQDSDIKLLIVFVRPLLSRFLESVSDDAAHVSSLKRTLAYEFDCAMDWDRVCINKMSRQFKEFVEKNKDVDPNLRFVVYCSGLKSRGGEKYRDAFYNRLNNTNVPSEANTVINALGCTENEELLKLYLKKLIEGSLPLKPDDPEDVMKVLMSISSNSRRAAAAILDFYNENAEDVVKYQMINADVARLLQNSIRTEEELKKLALLTAKPEMKQYRKILTVVRFNSEIRVQLSKVMRKRLLESLTPPPPKRGAGVVATFSKPLFISFTVALVGVL